MKKALAALLAAVALVAVPGDDASAWKAIRTQGNAWGRVIPSPVQYWRETQMLPCGVSVCPYHYLNVMTTGPLTVRRAPVRGAQNVAVQYVVQKWINNGWATVTTSRPFHRRIGRHQRRVRFPQWNVRPSAGPSGVKGNWRMLYLVAWANRRGSLGARAIAPNRYGEQYCALIVMNCSDYGHYLYVDRLIIPG